LDDQIILSGYGPQTAEFVQQKHAFMTMMLFDKWANDIFFPALKAKRKGPFKYVCQALLIMDGFGAHNTPAFKEQGGKEKVIVKFLVPHTSDRCQALDSLVFASFKSHYARKRVDVSDSQQTNRIIRLMRAWWAAMAPDIVVSSFKAVGIEPYIPLKKHESILQTGSQGKPKTRSPRYRTSNIISVSGKEFSSQIEEDP
jgi:hypothetical protein